MKAILTVIGRDKVGIVYRIAEYLQRHEINILDINQTVMDRFFTMVVLVDYSATTTKISELQEGLNALGDELGLKIKFQSEEIFDAMYSV